MHGKLISTGNGTVFQPDERGTLPGPNFIHNLTDYVLILTFIVFLFLFLTIFCSKSELVEFHLLESPEQFFKGVVKLPKNEQTTGESYF